MNALKEKMHSLSDAFREKIMAGGVKKLLTSRTFLVTGCAVLIAAAAAVLVLKKKK